MYRTIRQFCKNGDNLIVENNNLCNNKIIT